MNKIILWILCLAVLVLGGCEKVEIEDVPTFDRTEIISFKAYAKDKSSIITGNPVINTETCTVLVTVEKDTDLSAIFATCTLTSGSTISPALSGYQDWSAGTRTFTVTSASGKRSAEWKITLKK